MSPLLSFEDSGEVLAEPVGRVLDRGDWYVCTTHGFFVTGDPKEVTFRQWWDVGTIFHWRATSLKFQIADWLRFGAHKWREKFAQAQALFPHWDEQTLMNIQRVGNRIPPSRRFLEPGKELPFEYHEAVASSGPAQQVKMLSAAVEDPTITREVLRDMARSYEQADPDRARVEFRAIGLRRVISEADKAIVRLEGEARECAKRGIDAFREALRIVEGKKA